MRLENKVAVITGGASGMGLATVMRFLEEGARVVIADYNTETGNAALAAADSAGYRGLASFIRTDVASEPDVEAMLQRALDEYGGLDIVFNNAGVGGAVGPLTETTVSDWDYTFDVLAKGVFLGIKHAARIMKERRHGWVHHQHRIRRRTERRWWPAGLFGSEGGGHQPFEIGGRRTGARSDQSERNLPGIYRHAAFGVNPARN